MPWQKRNRLKRVCENEAQGRIREIYAETKDVFGVPYVDFVFQAFAVYPAFLELHWQALKTVVTSQQFFTLADRLRADAYTRAHSYLPVRDFGEPVRRMNLGEDEHRELVRVIDLGNYGMPLVLLTMAAQFLAFEAPIGRVDAVQTPADHPVFPGAPVLVEEDVAPTEVRRIFEELKRCLNLPFVPGEYQAFARWPEFLDIYWQSTKNAIKSPVYEGCHHALRETAFSLAREFPQPLQLAIPDLSESGMSDSDITSVVRITELFVYSLSASVLNLAVAKIGIEGGTRMKERDKAERAA
jgi:hypothetical protein